MKKQIPNWAFFLLIFAALTGAFWSIGQATPSKSSPPGQGAIKPVPAPVIEGITTTGGTFRLSDYKGKVVLINVWATWCGPCRMEIPDLVEIQKKYESKGFTIVGLSEDDDIKLPQAFAAQNGMTYPILLTPPNARQAFGIQAIPATYLVNKDGDVVWGTVGLIEKDQVTAEIEKVL